MTALVRGPNVRLPAGDWLLVGMVAIGGMAAGTLADASFYLATPLAMVLVYTGAVRHARETEASDLYAHPDLPTRARRAVEQAADQLPAGEARSLLAAVVAQAVLLYQAHATSVGEVREDGTMLDDVDELVESACTSAEQLALLDAATVGARRFDSDTRAARERFTSSLSTAATVIRNLHLAVVNSGTLASDRVAELNSDLRDEADARTRALTELATLLKRHSGS